ncbi:MAG TPA: dTDP-4-dehydrorhamnose reductase [Candidatus Megaira endosymbiont of Nemacystus decipiens]|nr:dTDP-4-dehydrorhamnose reductase [Candidatus Megaera endosymbiont of Nemacystus decipiens]
MKVLILGKYGQIANRLNNILQSLEMVILSLDRNDLEFGDLSKIEGKIRNYNPDIIINASGYTNVDKAEIEPEKTYSVNTEAVKSIVNTANEVGAWLIHYSSDYVFDGKLKRSYLETDEINPLSVYGKSKAMADLYIEANCQNYIILRVSAVFDSKGHNFPNTILKLAHHKTELRVVSDQYIVPTSALFISEITSLIVKLIKDKGYVAKGLYHLVPNGNAISWHQFAKILLSNALVFGYKLKCNPDNVIAINTGQYKQCAKRPLFSELSNSKIQETFGFTLSLWDKYLKVFMSENSVIYAKEGHHFSGR